MITSSSVTIDAPADLVWQVFSDVRRWPEWTASVTRVAGLDGPELAVGHRFQIDQPRMPRLRWTVTELDANTSWTWVQTSPGARTSACHDVVANPDGTTEVRQVLDQGGVIGGLVARLTRSMTRRYLDWEAQGLKGRSEELSKQRGPAT